MTDRVQHTPGPWFYDSMTRKILPRMLGTVPLAAHPDSTPLANLAPLATDADARLIATAPDLLAAAEAVVARHADSPSGPRPCQCETCQVLRAAIAKAKGE